ncbi:MAG: cobalamin-dependent protein [Anaerolineales bacterium]|nr:cobalamin-dependent protein [Anaerolineales bacterium]
MLDKVRVVVAKPGLDGHDRGVKIVARTLADAGMEVIYLGLRVPEETVVETALQEDAGVIGISNLSGALVPITARILELLAEKDGQDILLVVGGTVLDEDRLALNRMGVRGVFGPGTDPDDIVRFIVKELSVLDTE